jgi:hypothetical protein
MSSREMAFCLSEDRADCETGLRLAILSLSKYCPGTAVYVYRPPLNPQFASWVDRFPQVTLIPEAPAGANTWNCKPQALKPLLAAGHRQAIWLDSDIIVTRDCRPLFADLDDSVLGITQQPTSLPDQGTEIRARGWNLEIGRRVPFTLNTSVVRVTQFHAQLLDRWIECLADPRYISAQALPLEQRALHMMSDQDVFNALLGAKEFADIPLKVLASGTEIIHCGGALGYSLSERIRCLAKPKPTFLHATSGKPWLWLGGTPHWSQPGIFGWHRRLLQELSPYVFESRQYRNQLDEDASWMDRHTGLGRLLRFFGLGHFALRGLPLTLAATAMNGVKKSKAD